MVVEVADAAPLQRDVGEFVDQCERSRARRVVNVRESVRVQRDRGDAGLRGGYSACSSGPGEALALIRAAAQAATTEAVCTPRLRDQSADRRADCKAHPQHPLLHGLLIGDSHQEVNPFERLLSADWRSSPYIYCATREGPLPRRRT